MWPAAAPAGLPRCPSGPAPALSVHSPAPGWQQSVPRQHSLEPGLFLGSLTGRHRRAGVCVCLRKGGSPGGHLSLPDALGTLPFKVKAVTSSVSYQIHTLPTRSSCRPGGFACSFHSWMASLFSLGPVQAPPELGHAAEAALEKKQAWGWGQPVAHQSRPPSCAAVCTCASHSCPPHIPPCLLCLLPLWLGWVTGTGPCGRGVGEGRSWPLQRRHHAVILLLWCSVLLVIGH